MKRTFSVTREPLGVFMIHVDPIETETGTVVGFPALVVTRWVDDPEDFAERVAALLQGAQL